MSEYTDEEFLNTLEVAGPQALSPTARDLIRELFVRIRTLERRSLGDRVDLLEEIAQGMDGEIELLGRKPDGVDLRDRLTAVLTAVRDLSAALSESAKR